jgi:hypothetical protein
MRKFQDLFNQISFFSLYANPESGTDQGSIQLLRDFSTVLNADSVNPNQAVSAKPSPIVNCPQADPPSSDSRAVPSARPRPSSPGLPESNYYS